MVFMPIVLVNNDGVVVGRLFLDLLLYDDVIVLGAALRGDPWRGWHRDLVGDPSLWHHDFGGDP